MFDLSDVEEKHSDNYTWENTTYCGCKILLHTHVLDLRYEWISTEEHLAYCSCGYYSARSHSKGDTYGTSIGNIKTYCSKCKGVME